MKRRLLKDILHDILDALPATATGRKLAEELAHYQNNTPLFRVDYALPVMNGGGTVVRTTRKVFAFSGIMQNWYHGWFSLNVETGEIVFHCTDLNYSGTIMHDFMLWMENIPFPERYLKPIKHDDETKEIYLKKTQAAQDARKPRGKKKLAERDRTQAGEEAAVVLDPC